MKEKAWSNLSIGKFEVRHTILPERIASANVISVKKSSIFIQEAPILFR